MKDYSTKVHRAADSLAAVDPIRRTSLQVLRRLGNRDATIKHPHSGDRFRLNLYKHRNYWFKGATRERETVEQCTALIQPGDIVWDVGAHIGFMSLFFAHLVGPEGLVECFEPAPENLEYLTTNVRHRANTQILATAVSDTDGHVDLFVENDSGQNNSLIEDYEVLAQNREASNLPTAVNRMRVKCTTLDFFAASHPRPDFVKIDVEGAELAVLNGMRGVLQDCRPILMLEVTRTRGEVHAVLEHHDYVLRTPTGRTVTDASQLDFNIFAYPVHDNTSRKAMEPGWPDGRSTGNSQDK